MNITAVYQARISDVGKNINFGTAVLENMMQWQKF